MGPISYHTDKAKLHFKLYDANIKSAKECKNLKKKAEYEKLAHANRELGNYHSLQLKLYNGNINSK